MTDTNRKSEKIELNYTLQDTALDYKLNNTRLNFESNAIPTYVPLINPADISNLIFWGSAIQDATLYTTSGLATNVTTNGDPIGGVIDLSGHENALQATTTKRPLWRDVYQGKFVYHDRTDDELTIANLPAGDYTMCVALYGGTQVFEFTNNEVGYTLPVMDWYEIVIYTGTDLTAEEKAAIIVYLDTKTPSFSGIWRCWTAEANPPITGLTGYRITESGDSQHFWLTGDTQRDYDLKMDLTISPPNTVGLYSGVPGEILSIGSFYTTSYGNLPNWSTLGLSKLTHITCQWNEYGGSIPSFAGMVVTYVDLSRNNLVGHIPTISHLTGMTYFRLDYNELTGSIPTLPGIGGASSVTYIFDRNHLTGYEGGGVPDECTSFSAYINQLTQEAVDLILSDFVDAGASGGTLSLNGTGNATPSAAGLTDKATLQSRGWGVYTN